MRQSRFGLGVRKKLFPVRVMTPRHRLPREAEAGIVQGQLGQGWEQPEVVEGLPPHDRFWN